MKVYYITAFATEDKPQMTCVYPYSQWVEMILHFKRNGIEHEAWYEYI